MVFQEILAHVVGEDVIMNDNNIVDFVDHGSKEIKESFYVGDSPHIAI